MKPVIKTRLILMLLAVAFAFYFIGYEAGARDAKDFTLSQLGEVSQ